MEDWEFYTVEDGFFKGLNAVCLKPKHAGQKNKDLLLVNHTKKETHKKTQHLPILQTGKPFCVYNMIHLQARCFMPDKSYFKGACYFFRKEASVSQIKVRSFFQFDMFSLFLSHFFLSSLIFQFEILILFRNGRNYMVPIVCGEQVHTTISLLVKINSVHSAFFLLEFVDTIMHQQIPVMAIVRIIYLYY